MPCGLSQSLNARNRTRSGKDCSVCRSDLNSNLDGKANCAHVNRVHLNVADVSVFNCMGVFDVAFSGVFDVADANRYSLVRRFFYAIRASVRLAPVASLPEQETRP